MDRHVRKNRGPVVDVLRIRIRFRLHHRVRGHDVEIPGRTTGHPDPVAHLRRILPIHFRRTAQEETDTFLIPHPYYEEYGGNQPRA